MFVFFRDVCKIMILMSDLNEFETMNKVYEEVLREHLGEEPLPARTTFQAGRVPRDARSVFIVYVVFIAVY
jgi:enamine deaminase RidA (YjgF/YER057c/UK114 family)